MDFSTGKYQRPSDEIYLVVPLDHEHFQAIRAITHDQNGSRRNRSDRVCLTHLASLFAKLSGGKCSPLRGRDQDISSLWEGVAKCASTSSTLDVRLKEVCGRLVMPRSERPGDVAAR